MENTYGLRCDIFLTARVNPFPSHRSDLLRRTLTFPIRKPEQHEYITMERMQQDLMADREEMLLETLVRLRNVLRGMEANKEKEYPPVSEMHSYETWTMMIADHEGWAEEMVSIWQGYRGDYQERIAEDSPLVEFVRRWIGSRVANVGRWARPGEIYAELKSIYGRAFDTLFRSDAALGKKLKENYTALRTLGVDHGSSTGRRFISLIPVPEQLETCAHSFTDSASRNHLGDPLEVRELEKLMSE